MWLRFAGTTYNPDQGEVLELPSSLDAVLAHIAEVCAVCNESRIDCTDGVFKAVGAPTEASLKVGGGSFQYRVTSVSCRAQTGHLENSGFAKGSRGPSMGRMVTLWWHTLLAHAWYR